MKNATRNTFKKTAVITAIVLSTVAPVNLLRGQPTGTNTKQYTLSPRAAPLTEQMLIDDSEIKIRNLESNIIALERTKAINFIDNSIVNASTEGVENLADNIKHRKGIDNLEYGDHLSDLLTGFVIGAVLCVVGIIRPRSQK